MTRKVRVTWTLRLYDTDDMEIAWIRADPYGWEITHPDPGWSELEVSIAAKEDGSEMSQLPLEGDGFSGHSERLTYHDETPKDHLEWVQENIQFADGVDSTMLFDE